MKFATSVILLCTLFSTPALAQVSLGTSCGGSTVDVVIEVSMNTFVEEPEGHSIIIQARVLGDCVDPITIPAISFPMPPHMESATYSCSFDSPDPGRYFMYIAMGVDPQGATYDLPPSGDALQFDFCGLEDAIAARGFLTTTQYGEIIFTPCDGYCWLATEYPCSVDMNEAEPGWEDFLDTGQVVNLYGRAYADGMPGAPCVFVSRVEEETGGEGCGTVATEATSWDHMKAVYR